MDVFRPEIARAPGVARRFSVRRLRDRRGVTETRRRGRRPTGETCEPAIRRSSATVDVTYAGRPRVARQALSSISTTGPGQRPAVSLPELLRRELVEADRASDGGPDGGHLVGLTQRLRAGEDVIPSRMPVLVQRARRHRPDVALVDRRRLRRAVGPPDHVALPDRGAHHIRVFEANMPGRMIVDAIPVAATRRSRFAWKTAMGFGCWKNGCGVWCGEERSTTRGTRAARRSMTAGAVAGGAVQRRNTAPTPCSAASSDSGTVRSPATTSTAAGSPASAGRRVRARTGTPAARSCATTSRPTRPVAPVTRTGRTAAPVIAFSEPAPSSIVHRQGQRTFRSVAPGSTSTSGGGDPCRCSRRR